MRSFLISEVGNPSKFFTLDDYHWKGFHKVPFSLSLATYKSQMHLYRLFRVQAVYVIKQSHDFIKLKVITKEK